MSFHTFLNRDTCKQRRVDMPVELQTYTRTALELKREGMKREKRNRDGGEVQLWTQNVFRESVIGNLILALL